nr:MAG TPA: hypothetical protein [Bacteriophage sp.]
MDTNTQIACNIQYSLFSLPPAQEVDPQNSFLVFLAFLFGQNTLDEVLEGA